MYIIIKAHCRVDGSSMCQGNNQILATVVGEGKEFVQGELNQVVLLRRETHHLDTSIEKLLFYDG